MMALLSVATSGLVRAETPTPPFSLQFVADIPLPGRSSRYDYQSYDAARHLLFIAHLGDSAVTVFNTQSQTVVTNIPNVSRVHGMLAIPVLGKYRGIWMDIFKFACSVGLSERNLAELTLVKTPSERKRKHWTLEQYKAVTLLPNHGY
jgi:hypothetical protein